MWLIESLDTIYLDNFGKIFSIEVIIGFEKHFTQSRLADWVVFGIELIETMESVSILQRNKCKPNEFLLLRWEFDNNLITACTSNMSTVRS